MRWIRASPYSAISTRYLYPTTRYSESLYSLEAGLSDENNVISNIDDRRLVFFDGRGDVDGSWTTKRYSDENKIRLLDDGKASQLMQVKRWFSWYHTPRNRSMATSYESAIRRINGAIKTHVVKELTMSLIVDVSADRLMPIFF